MTTVKAIGPKVYRAVYSNPGCTIGELVLIINAKFDRNLIFQALTRMESLGLIKAARKPKASGELEPGAAGYKFCYYVTEDLMKEATL